MQDSTKAKPGTKPGTLSPKATGHGPVFNIRQRAGKTQKQFAEATGVSRPTIARAEAAGDYPQSLLAQDAILRYAKEHDLEEPNIL